MKKKLLLTITAFLVIGNVQATEVMTKSKIAPQKPAPIYISNPTRSASKIPYGLSHPSYAAMQQLAYAQQTATGSQTPLGIFCQECKNNGGKVQISTVSTTENTFICKGGTYNNAIFTNH